MMDTKRQERKALIRQRHRALIHQKDTYTKNHRREAGCMDCRGARYPDLLGEDGKILLRHASVLQFDHRPGEEKRANVSDLVHKYNASWDRIDAEMAKCDVVCGVCHQLRTDRRKEDGRVN